MFPEHFIIYRDGVGDGMREQVLEEEVSQLNKLIKSGYQTTKQAQPSVTVVIVNKRITQRFF